MSYTFEENSARMTDVFHGIAKRTMDEVREEITKAHRSGVPRASAKRWRMIRA